MPNYIQPQYPQNGGGFAAYCAATYCVLRVLRYCVMRHSLDDPTTRSPICLATKAFGPAAMTLFQQ